MDCPSSSHSLFCGLALSLAPAHSLSPNLTLSPSHLHFLGGNGGFARSLSLTHTHTRTQPHPPHSPHSPHSRSCSLPPLPFAPPVPSFFRFFSRSSLVTSSRQRPPASSTQPTPRCSTSTVSAVQWPGLPARCSRPRATFVGVGLPFHLFLFKKEKKGEGAEFLCPCLRPCSAPGVVCHTSFSGPVFVA